VVEHLRIPREVLSSNPSTTKAKQTKTPYHHLPPKKGGIPPKKGKEDPTPSKGGWEHLNKAGHYWQYSFPPFGDAQQGDLQAYFSDLAKGLVREYQLRLTIKRRATAREQSLGTCLPQMGPLDMLCHPNLLAGRTQGSEGLFVS
jgi:hypothetical protein